MDKFWLIFTDLDGTLLDHHNYSFAAALPALKQLRALDIPVIINSSKTLKEIESIANELALDSPSIAENGSIVQLPEQDSPKVFGAEYSSICDLLDQLRNQEGFEFSGFHDWNAEEIAKVTGLDLVAAGKAGQRKASEPILWRGTDERRQQFARCLAEHDLLLKRGGRFWHIMGQTDKVKAMKYLVEHSQQKYQQKHQQQWNTKPVVIALGDGPNDQEMLAAADIAVVVNNPNSDGVNLPQRAGQQQIRTVLTGPAGWNAAIQQLLETG